jgi:hypothetical protein
MSQLDLCVFQHQQDRQISSNERQRCRNFLDHRCSSWVGILPGYWTMGLSNLGHPKPVSQRLSNKTTEVMEDVAHDTTAAECIKLTHQELLEAASEWDDGLQTALAAWGDFIEMQREGNSGHLMDTEKQPKRDADHLAKQRKKHARFMIRFMRAKVLEGLEHREELSSQLQRIHVAVKTR